MGQCSESKNAQSPGKPMLVIPANAGIQSKMMCAALDIKVLSASHDVLKLDSGVRRNDGEVGGMGEG